MGHQNEAKCLACSHEFTVDHGGGFMFHLLRCNKCGKTKSIRFDKLGELRLRYLRGLPGPCCVATTEQDKRVQDHAPVKPISERGYGRGVEAAAGNCACGGKYKLKAPTRCPKCRSSRIEEGQTILDYD